MTLTDIYPKENLRKRKLPYRASIIKKMITLRADGASYKEINDTLHIEKRDSRSAIKRYLSDRELLSTG